MCGTSTPASFELRVAAAVSMDGGTQRHVLCAANRSQLCSGDSCGDGRGRVRARSAIEDFVLSLYTFNLYLA